MCFFDAKRRDVGVHFDRLPRINNRNVLNGGGGREEERERGVDVQGLASEYVI